MPRRVRTIKSNENHKNPESNSVNLAQNKPEIPEEVSNNISDNNPARDEVTVLRPSPNEDTIKQVNADTHKNCVQTEFLTDFIQSITTVLLTGISFSPDTSDLVAKLCQLVDTFVKSINKRTN